MHGIDIQGIGAYLFFCLAVFNNPLNNGNPTQYSQQKQGDINSSYRKLDILSLGHHTQVVLHTPLL
jgi:hypothetical protein